MKAVTGPVTCRSYFDHSLCLQKRTEEDGRMQVLHFRLVVLFFFFTFLGDICLMPKIILYFIFSSEYKYIAYGYIRNTQ